MPCLPLGNLETQVLRTLDLILDADGNVSYRLREIHPPPMYIMTMGLRKSTTSSRNRNRIVWRKTDPILFLFIKCCLLCT